MTIRGSNGYFGRAKFWGYLQDLPPNEIVGIRNTINHCPIATFLAHLIPEHGPFLPILVTDSFITYHVQEQYHNHNTPRWAAAFIAAIDSHGPPQVTAAEALAALD